MKRLTALFLALAMCLSLCTVTAFATGQQINDSTVTWELTENNTKLTIGGTGAMPNFEECTDRPWHDKIASITDIVIQSGVTSIGDNAFSGCTSLANVTVEATTPPTLGTDAFKDYGSNLKIYVPANKAKEYRGTDGWSDYSSKIKSAPVPGNGNQDDPWQIGKTTLSDVIAYLYDGTLFIKGTGEMMDLVDVGGQPWIGNKDSIENVVIGSNVTTIGDFAFYSFKKLASVTIPKGVTRIGIGAFSMSALTSVTVKATTPPTLGTNVFNNCNALKKIYVPAGTKTAYTDNWSSYAEKIEEVALTTFTVTVSLAVHGTVTATPTDVASGTDVTLTVKPDDGYKLASLTVTKQGGDTVAVTGDKFTMPNEDVTVTAVFVIDNGPTPDDDHDVDYEKLAKAGMVAAGVVAGVVVTKIVVDKLHEIKAAKDAAAEATPEINVEEMPMVAMGSSGDAVTTLQTKLNELGYNCGEVDGVFGNNTYTAVCSFQTAKGLTADGIVGTQTWDVLL